jgi:hypothetical protein
MVSDHSLADATIDGRVKATLSCPCVRHSGMREWRYSSMHL